MQSTILHRPPLKRSELTSTCLKKVAVDGGQPSRFQRSLQGRTKLIGKDGLTYLSLAVDSQPSHNPRTCIWVFRQEIISELGFGMKKNLEYKI